MTIYPQGMLPLGETHIWAGDKGECLGNRPSDTSRFGSRSVGVASAFTERLRQRLQRDFICL